MFIPILLGFVIVFVSGWLRKTVFGGSVPINYDNIIMGLFFILCSLGGIGPIIKKKVPGAFGKYIEGKPAIVLGCIWCVFFLALSINAFGLIF